MAHESVTRQGVPRAAAAQRPLTGRVARMSFRSVFIALVIGFWLVLAKFLINRQRPGLETDRGSRPQPSNFWLNRELGAALLIEGRNGSGSQGHCHQDDPRVHMQIAAANTVPAHHPPLLLTVPAELPPPP